MNYFHFFELLQLISVKKNTFGELMFIIYGNIL